MVLEISKTMAEGPPEGIQCSCSGTLRRDWQADAPMIDTSMCKDHSDVAPEHRTASAWDRGSPERMEGQFQQHIQERRSQLKDGNRGSIRHKMSVPTHLYHGKIKESGDKQYWSDPRNLRKHKDCEVG